MSPLIATVLLMAFAVALGAMLMNSRFDINVNSDCDDLQEHVQVTHLCVQGSTVVLRAQAGPDGPVVQGVKLTIVSGEIENTVNVLNSKLEPNGRLDLSVPVLAPAGAHVDLIGLVGPAAEPVACTDTPIERVDPIQPC